MSNGSLSVSLPGARPTSRSMASQCLTDVKLSERQRQILTYLADGWTLTEIARELRYSVRTLKSDLHRLGFRTRSQAVATAIRAGWI
jgi:DNA-binding NarL/FixJ family response regulator